MKKELSSTLFWILLILFFIANIYQGIHTNLYSDEAYYWTWSQHLDWGFFSHPPMVALWIRMGTLFLKGELGVRLLFILAGPLTFLLGAKMVGKENRFSFLLFYLSLYAAHLAGIVASPDIPQMLFVMIFFSLYDLYLRRDELCLTLLLALVCTCLVYTKYHCFLIFLFTLIANPSLAKRKSFWTIVSLVVLLIIPHIIWQFRYHFPTLQFHLFLRNMNPLKSENILMYFFKQFRFYGPWMLPFYLYLVFKIKPQHLLQKTLKWNVLGFFTFFLISSLRWVTADCWNSPVMVPMVVLVTQQVQKINSWKRPLAVAATLSLLFLTYFRTYYYPFKGPLPLIPNFTLSYDDGHLRETFLAFDQAGQGAQFVFINNFGLSAKYDFYTGKYSHYFQYGPAKINEQYDLWEREKSLQGKKVCIYQGHSLPIQCIVPFYSHQKKIIFLSPGKQKLTNYTFPWPGFQKKIR